MLAESCNSGPPERKVRARESARRPDRAIGDLAEKQYGVVSRSQLRTLGVADGAIESRLRRGALRPLYRAVYAVGHGRLVTEGRWLGAVLASGPGAVLSHRSAGQLWGLLSRASIRPEVTRPRSFGRRPGIVAHQSTLPADEVEVVDGIPVTSVARTLLDLAGVLSRPRLEQALNEAEARQLTGRLSLPGLMRRYPGRRGAATLRKVLEDGSAGITRLELERRFAALVEAHGLPKPRRNAHLAVRGRFFEVDCLWQRHRLVVELDGYAVHGTRRTFESDRERDRLLLAEGWRPMRVTWRQLRDEPQAIVRDLRGLLAGSAEG